jgi:uncharacterized protein YdeI (YjbR/CyaY-like superfamily)
MRPTFFKTQADFRKWLENNHATASELLVGFYKKGSGKPSITWPESVDEALCFGWIDGIRKSLDHVSYTIRFTPRKPRSIWRAVNIRRAQELADQGLMQPAGLKVFQERLENKSGQYSYEQRPQKLPEPYEKRMKRNAAAWKFFEARPPYYRKTVTWWVVSAKREETRLKRLDKLIEDCAKGQLISEFNRPKKPE